MIEKSVIKVIHVLSKNILIILTDKYAYKLVSKIMKKYYKFKEMEQEPDNNEI